MNLNLHQQPVAQHQNVDLTQLPANELIRRGNLRMEKCEIKEAGRYFEMALEQAKSLHDLRAISDALAHLLRYSSEIGNESAIQRWAEELEMVLAQKSGKSSTQGFSPNVWYCRGIVAYRNAQFKKAQVLFHRFWQEVEKEENESNGKGESHSKLKAQAFLALSLVAIAQGKLKRARYFGEVILRYAELERPRNILTSTYLMLVRLAERASDTAQAKHWLQKAFSESVSEHNWHHYLYVLYGYARIYRIEQDFVQARFYLDLLEKAIVAEEFKNLKNEIAEERVKLNLNRVDLEIDLNRSVLRTREGEINLRRQHLLIEIIHQLAIAHEHRDDEASKLGLSKQEIIEKVWKENYNPEAHDGKLYYNINRIRKLLEQDQKNPVYLLNWRQGYRLAPELKVRITKGEN